MSEIRREADRAVSLALEAFRRGELETCLAELERALSLEPDHLDALEAKGVVLDKLDRTDDAIVAMERLRDLRPDLVMAWTNLSRFYVKKGWKEKAEEAQGRARVLGLEADLEEAADSAAAPSLVELAQKQPSAATAGPTERGPDPAVLARRIAQFEAILAHRPEDPLTRFSLGRALLQADQVQRAADLLGALVAERPETTAAYLPLGEAHLRLGHLARAIRTWKKGIEVAEERGDRLPQNQMQEALRRIGSV